MWKQMTSEKRSPVSDTALFTELLSTLKGAIRTNRWVAGAIFFFGMVGAGVAIWYLPILTGQGIDSLADQPDNWMLGIYVLLRSAAYAGVVTAILYGTFNLGRAALDQAERYKKRQMAAHFMHYVFAEYRDRIGDEGFKVAEIIDAIDAWSRNVESAYTKVRFGGKGPETWSTFANKDGAGVAFGATAVKASASANKPATTAS